MEGTHWGVRVHLCVCVHGFSLHTHIQGGPGSFSLRWARKPLATAQTWRPGRTNTHPHSHSLLGTLDIAAQSWQIQATLDGSLLGDPFKSATKASACSTSLQLSWCHEFKASASRNDNLWPHLSPPPILLPSAPIKTLQPVPGARWQQAAQSSLPPISLSPA